MMSITIYILTAMILNQSHYVWSAVTIAIYVILVLSYPMLYKRLAKRAINKELTDTQRSNVFGTKTIELDDENNIKIISKKKVEHIPFNNIIMIRVNKDMIYLYLDAVSALIIPTRDLDESTKKEINKRLCI